MMMMMMITSFPSSLVLPATTSIIISNRQSAGYYSFIESQTSAFALSLSLRVTSLILVLTFHSLILL